MTQRLIALHCGWVDAAGVTRNRALWLYSLLAHLPKPARGRAAVYAVGVPRPSRRLCRPAGLRDDSAGAAKVMEKMSPFRDRGEKRSNAVFRRGRPRAQVHRDTAAVLRQLVKRLLAARDALPDVLAPAAAPTMALLVVAGKYFGQASADEYG